MPKSATIITILIILSRLSLAQQEDFRNEISKYNFIVDNQEVKNLNSCNEGYYMVSLSDNQPATLQEYIKNTSARKLSEEKYIIYLSKEYTESARTNALKGYKVNNNWKLTKELQSILNSDSNSSTRQFIIKTKNIKSCNVLTNYNKNLKIIKQFHHTHTLIVETTTETLKNEIIPNKDIVFINLFSPFPSPESTIPGHNLNVNQINKLKRYFPYLKGEDIRISLKEEKFRETDLDLLNRSIPSSLASNNYSSHATDMATIIAGAGNTSPYTVGVASAAQLSSSYYTNLLPDDASYFANDNIYLQNHSYGTSIENYYGALAEAYDYSTAQNKKLLHIFSIGNNGAGIDSLGTYQGVSGFANMTGNFKMAKNIITVASVDTVYKPDAVVSRGPAFDGRVTPSISAFSLSGSSASTALVSGTAAIMQEAYFKQFNSMPDAAIIKAILLNTADDVGREGIDFATGYGNLNSYKALKNLKNEQYLIDSIESSSSKSTTIDIPENVQNLKILITWWDQPAAANDYKALVNDLDLSIYHNQKKWLPWVLNSYPHEDSLMQLPKRNTDHLNTVEQITIEKPDVGTYNIEIKSNELKTPYQKFVISYDWDTVNNFNWSYPVKNDILPYTSEINSIIRWKSTFFTHGSLSYSLDNGNTWTLINNHVDLSKGYYTWSTPNIYSRALLKMSIDDEEYISEGFSISTTPKPTVGFNCTDSVMIAWPKNDVYKKYIVYSLKNNFLEPIFETQDTSYIFNKETTAEQLFAVEPQFTDNAPAARSLTFDYQIQGTECYFISFLTNEHQAEGYIELNLKLGTLYQIEEVVFERLNSSGNYDIISSSSPNNIEILAKDNNPNQGLNLYRARLIFKNGQEIYTDNIPAYFLSTLEALIFPNPVNNNSELSVYSKSFESFPSALTIYDDMGREVLSQKLNSEREFVLIPNLKPGIYIYKINNQNTSTTGRLCIK